MEKPRQSTVTEPPLYRIYKYFQTEEQSEGKATELLKLKKLNESFSDRVKSLEDELMDARKCLPTSPGNCFSVSSHIF